MPTKLRKCFLLERRRHAVKISSPTRSKLFPFNFEISQFKGIKCALPQGFVDAFSSESCSCREHFGHFRDFCTSVKLCKATVNILEENLLLRPYRPSFHRNKHVIFHQTVITFLLACHNQSLIFYNHISTIQTPPFTCKPNYLN